MVTTNPQLRGWLKPGAWALADQGLFVLAAALMNILLARWLPPAEYGAFAVSYSTLLFFGALHNALLIEPMLVFGSGRYASLQSTYLSALLRTNHFMLVSIGAVLIVVGGGLWIFGSHAVAAAMLGLAFAGPSQLFMWLTKRATYLRQRTHLAARQSGIYLVLMLPSLYILKTLGLISAFSTTIVMGLSAILCGWWLVKHLRRSAARDDDSLSQMDVVRSHWHYGRWAMLSSILAWVPLNFFIIALSFLIGLEASAALKAVTNIALPALQANAAMSALLLPLFGSCKEDISQLRSLLWRALLLFVCLASCYAIAICLLGGTVIHSLYQGRYDVVVYLPWLIAIIPVIDGITGVLAGILRSAEQPRKIFEAQVAATIFLFSAGIVSAAIWGVIGAIISILLAGLITVVALAVATWRMFPITSLRSDRAIAVNSEHQGHCELCRASGALYGRTKDYDLLNCPECRLVWTNPLKSQQPLDSGPVYVGEEVYLANASSQKKRFRKQLKTYLCSVNGADLSSLKLLEVGSGLGLFLDVCEELGINAEGCDIVERAVDHANRDRKRVRLGTLDDFYQDNSYDAIFAFNLIEHLPHPKEFLRQAHRILKPDGMLVLETPIQEGLFHRLARIGHVLSNGRLNFFGMRPGGHIYKFSKRTFGQQLGFDSVYERNIESPFRELWGNSSVLKLDHKTLYRWSLPLAWAVAKVTNQGNRLFLLLRKSMAADSSIDIASDRFATSQ